MSIMETATKAEKETVFVILPKLRIVRESIVETIIQLARQGANDDEIISFLDEAFYQGEGANEQITRDFITRARVEGLGVESLRELQGLLEGLLLEQQEK